MTFLMSPTVNNIWNSVKLGLLSSHTGIMMSEGLDWLKVSPMTSEEWYFHEGGVL